MRQKITKDIINTVKIRSDKPSDVIDEVIFSMWEFVAHTMETAESSAIYLRYLGTFYSNEDMRNGVIKNRGTKKKDDTGEFQGGK